MNTSEDLRYPIGRMPVLEGPASAHQRDAWIRTIEDLPGKLRSAVEGSTPEQWDTPYRPGGWTVRQLVHHIPDSHMHAYIRFKLGLTEDEPTVKTYDEAAWADLVDTRQTEPDVSLRLLEALHARWVVLLRSTPAAAYRRTFRHPEHRGTVVLEQLLAQYAWHSEHHLRHITALRERRAWT